MTEQQQAIPTDEEAEREFAAADEAFRESNEGVIDEEFGGEIGDIEEAEPKKTETAQVEAPEKTPSPEEIAKRYQDILIALGFTQYDNKEKGIACKLKVGSLLIGRTFTEKHPIGNMWVSCLVDCEHGKKGEFLKKDECKQIPQVNLFYRIRDGELPIPEPTVAGKVVGKSEKAVQIQFDEFGQSATEWWGFGALKKNEKGTNYVPASYSKETAHYTAKMQVPRDIILKDYEAELKAALLTTQTDTTKEKEEPQEKAQSQPTEKSTMDEAIKREPTEYTEAIAKYTGILAEVTEAILAEDRIPSREKGYATKFVYYSVVGEMENGKGSDHKE